MREEARMEDKVKVLSFALPAHSVLESFRSSVHRVAVETMSDGTSSLMIFRVPLICPSKKGMCKKGTPVSTADQPEITVEKPKPFYQI
ncbi:hypothetical protein CEXT_589711 [Caerostris extrusa]|uniref:Uncharacterized protein n=1 Tax=Caerostris extrusa TaxID=172846 RepID=A0AAV4P0E3_CAEEX|nr:hypothetical protein CEXT_589711 [Caerostris extrusa]